MPTATILVVDDNASSLKATVRLLEQAGCAVVAAADGAAALRECRAHRPDLVLLDVMLPDIPGLEVLRRIKADPDTAGTTVVMLSALQTKPEQQAVGLDTGADGYLSRPIANTELLARVRAILRQREQTEEVRRSEGFHRTIFEASPQPMWVYDAETLRFVAVNNAAVTHYGYSREEFLGMTIFDIRPADEIPALREAIAKLPEGVHQAGAWRHRLKDGRIVMMDITAYTLDYAGKRARMVIANDITERLAAEGALRRQADQLVKAQRIAHLGSWELNLAANTISCSEEVHRIFGLKYDPAASGRELFFAHIHPDDRDKVATAKSRLLAGEGPQEVEHRVVRRGGEIRHVVERAELVCDERGAPVAIAGTLQDITERKLAEENVWELANRLSTTLESITDGFLAFDAEWRITYINRQGEHMLQRTREELLGKVVWDEFPEARGSLFEQQYEKARREQAPVEFESYYPPLEIWFEVRAFPNGRDLAVYFRDITAYRAGREALRERDALSRMAGRLARIGAWSVDLETRQSLWSDEVCAIHGVPPGHRTTVEEGLAYYAPEHRPAITQAFGDCVNEGRPFDLELQIITASGHRVWVRVLGEPVRDETGKIIRVQGAFQDITERKLAEAALNESQQRFEEMAGNIGEIFYNYDPAANRLLYVNRAYERIWGRPLQDILADPMSYLDAVHPDDREAVEAALQRQLKGERTTARFRIVRPDGGIRWIREVAIPVPDAEGNMARIVGTMHDITETEHATAALRESEERFRSLLQSVPSVAIQGYALDGAVQYWNDASERFYGYTREEALRGNLLDLIIPPEMRDDVRAALRGVAEGRPIPNGELLLMRKDGSRIPVFSSHAIVRREGHPPELFCIDIDLSERERAEAERRQLVNDLRERVKELRALHRVAELLRGDGLTLRELLRKIVSILPAAMQHPEVTAVRVVFGDIMESTAGYRDTPWRLDADFNTAAGTAGRLQIAYLEERPPLEEGPFHAEERSLINSLAEMLRSYFDRRMAESESRHFNETLQGIVAALQEIAGANLPLKEVMEKMAARAQQLTGATGAIIEFAEDDDMVYKAASGNAVRMIGMRLPIKNSLSGATLKTGEPQVCEDSETDDRVDREACRKVGLRSMVIVPLRDGSDVIGVLKVFSDRPAAFTPRDNANLQILVESLGSVIQRRRAADRLAEQATLLDKAQDAILVRDLDDRILYWNQSAERMYGWTAGEITGRPVGEVLYRDPAAFRAATEQVKTLGEWVGEIEQCTKTGGKLTVEGHWTLVRDDQGNPKSILAINTDITERKKLEQQFLRAQRMESIGTLAGGIAHDLNNLLAPILMGVGLLRQTETRGDVTAILTNIERSAKRGADLVRQVLSFARGVEGARVAVQIRHIVQEVENIAKNTFPKNIVFERQLAADLRPVTGDPTQINQVLMNLCVNARDAMPNGGRLVVSARNTEVDAQFGTMNGGVAAGPYVVIEVADEGVGMPPEVVERVFEPFFTTKEPGKGTGLGLSTVLGIVRSHGGFLNVSSEVGRGSVFKVHLPAMPEDGAAAGPDETEPESLPRGHGEVIMVVDDEATIRNVTQQTLEAFGYRVLTAEDGAQAISVYALHRDEIALVLTDMMMPVMDGPALVTALKRVNPAVKVIAASGLNAAGHTGRAGAAGVRHFLAKPYSAEAMLTLIRKVLAESTSRSPF